MNYQKLEPGRLIGNELMYRITPQYISIVDLEGDECIVLDHTQLEQLAEALCDYNLAKEQQRHVGLQFEQNEFEHPVP